MTSAPGPPRRLTHEQIVEAAVRILDEDPQGLSLRRLAGDLGVTPMTLYRYYGSKAEILDAVFAHTLSGPPAGPSTELPWHERLRETILGIHDSLSRRRGVAVIAATQSMVGAGTDEIREHLLSLMLEAGLTETETIAGLGAIVRYLMGCVLLESQDRRESEAEEIERLGALDPETFPTLSRLADRYTEHEQRAAMEFGLDLIITDLRRIADGR